MRPRLAILVTALLLVGAARWQTGQTQLTVRLLLKSRSSVLGVTTTQSLPAQGFNVKVGDRVNPVRYCDRLHADPPARVDCQVPAGAEIVIRVARQSVGEHCPEPFVTPTAAPLAITVRVDPQERAIVCRITTPAPGTFP